MQPHDGPMTAVSPSPASVDFRPASRARRIAIDGFNLSMDKGTGVATYGRSLTHALKSMGASVDVLYGAPISARQDDLLKEVLFFDMPRSGGRLMKMLRQLRAMTVGNSQEAFSVPISGSVITAGMGSRLPSFDKIWNVNRLFDRASGKFDIFKSIQQVQMPERPDLMHWTYPLPVRVKGCQNIYTLHDLVPLRLPYTTLDKKASYLALMKWIAKTADHIVTVSEASKRDIIRLLGVPESRVTNTYQAVHLPRSVMDRSDSDVANLISSVFGLQPRDYFIFYGSIEPKKNIGRIVEAFMTSGVASQLVIVGARAWKAAEETRLLDALPSSDRRIVRLDYLPFPMLMDLVRAARAVLFPSLYEGFGLPVLEAMMLGTPVLASSTSSLPEVVGDAALLVDPYDTREIAAAICRFEDDDDLCFELSQRGRVQAQKFSMDQYKVRLENMYGTLGV